MRSPCSTLTERSQVNGKPRRDVGVKLGLATSFGTSHEVELRALLDYDRRKKEANGLSRAQIGSEVSLALCVVICVYLSLSLVP